MLHGTLLLSTPLSNSMHRAARSIPPGLGTQVLDLTKMSATRVRRPCARIDTYRSVLFPKLQGRTRLLAHRPPSGALAARYTYHPLHSVHP